MATIPATKPGKPITIIAPIRIVSMENKGTGGARGG
jgi:hypothetical protein